ncbi:MAG: hypothetical protein ACRDIC_03950 [bacterium]
MTDISHPLDASLRESPAPPLRELLAVFVVVLAIYVAVTPRPHGFYHHYVYMAKAFLAGRVDLVGIPAHYHDVIHLNGKVYAPFQPLPAVLVMPLVALRGDAAHPGRMGQVIAAAAVAVFVGALGRLGRPRPVRLFTGVALGLGSILWSATAIGSTWFFAHTVVTLMLVLVIWELAGAARGWLVGLLLAGAWLARATLLPAIPAVAVLLLLRHRTVRPLIGFGLASAAGLAVLAAYNYARFGTPWEAGYGMLSLALPSAITVGQTGYVGLEYIPRHLHTMLFRAPVLLDSWPFLKPDPNGMALIFTSPIIVRVLFAKYRARALAWLLPIAAVAGPTLIFFSTGWIQFGYRYSLDWWPFALVLLACALRERPAAVDWALLAAAVAMNALGVYWVRALGW